MHVKQEFAAKERSWRQNRTAAEEESYLETALKLSLRFSAAFLMY
jgi:hypothetical protein